MLCCSWRNDGGAIFAGCADGTTKMIDVSTNNIQNIGKQNAPVSTLHWIQEMNVLMVNSFDKSMNFLSPGTSSPVASFGL